MDLKWFGLTGPIFLGMHQEWIATLTQTAASLDELSKGVYVFLLEGFFFLFFFCIFIDFYLLNETWEIFLHAGCNPVSTLPAHVFSVSRHFYIYWEFRLLLLFLKNIFGLPTVMDPSSVIRNFFFFVCFSSFVLLQIHLVFGHANLDICQVLWIRDSFVVPT